MRLAVVSLAGMLVCAVYLHAQTRGETTYYPMVLVAGENIVTVSNAAGIERVRSRSSANVQVVIPRIVGCPTSVDVRVVVQSPEVRETVTFTTYDCTGAYASTNLSLDTWTILHHQIGPLVVGEDTCTDAVVSLGARDEPAAIGDDDRDVRVIDSMVSDDPEVTIKLPLTRGRGWEARVGEPLPYEICYAPTRADTHTTILRLYVRRRFPHKGLVNYMIGKPVTVRSYVPPPPPEPEKPDPMAPPPLVDPTTFRSIVMPTAETLERGKAFVGNYDIAGWLGGYGITDDLMVMGGGALLPAFIQKVAVGTIGVKYCALTTGPLQASVGAQYAYSSAETDISTFAPYAVLSVGNRANRISLAGGYTWKTHTSATSSFSENATVFGIGGDVTVKRGWKLALETYFIEKSGLQPVTFTSRWFGESLAFDVGFILDIKGTSGVQSNGALSGKIQELRAAPLLSLLYVF